MKTENKIKIDSIYPDDWKKFKSLWLEALTDSPQAFSHSYKELADRTFEKWQEKIKKYSDKKSKDKIIVAKDRNNFIGMMGFFEKREGAANIYAVYINPQYRGKKISDMLMKALLNFIKQEPSFREIELSVNKNQKAAIGFYKRNGFTIIEEMQNVKMGDGTICNEYLMKRKV